MGKIQKPTVKGKKKRAHLDKRNQRAQELRRLKLNKRDKPVLKVEMKRTGLNAKLKDLYFSFIL